MRVDQPALSGRHVAHLAVHDDGPKDATANRLPAEDDRRPRKMITGEDRRGGRIDLAHEYGEILRRWLEAAVAARRAKAARKPGWVVEHRAGRILRMAPGCLPAVWPVSPPALSSIYERQMRADDYEDDGNELGDAL